MNRFNIYGNRLFEAEPGGGTPPAEPKPADPINTNGKDLPDEVKKQLDRLAYLEKENKELISQRDKVKEAKRKEEEDKLKAQGELQKLLDAKEKEIEELTKTLKPKADAFEQLRQSEIEDAKKTLGDKWDDEYSNLSLTALRKMVSTLSAKKPDPKIDPGTDGTKPEIVLTKEQEKRALEMFPNWAQEKAFNAYKEILAKQKPKK